MPARNIEVRDRLLAPVAVFDDKGEVVGANLGVLVRRLILFEEVVIDSYAMRELPQLIEVIGPSPFLSLMSSGALRIRADARTIAETSSIGSVGRARNAPLPHLHYALSHVAPDDPEHHVSLSLGEIRNMTLGRRTSQSIRRAIVAALVHYPEGAERHSLSALPRDLTGNLNLVNSATAAALSTELCRPVSTNGIEIRIERVDDSVFAATTNIGQLFDLQETQTHAIVQNAILSIAYLDYRLHEIDAYHAMVGFQEGELDLVREKLGFLVSQMSPDVHEARFGRVVSLADLPDPATSPGTVNIERLIDARDSDELRNFRAWLRTIDQVSDEEIEAHLASVRSRVAQAVQGTSGKTLRFLVTSAIGMLGGGPVAGAALGGADQFLVERLLGKPGPVSFLGSTYRSLFI
jgi:hypothetical protein